MNRVVHFEFGAEDPERATEFYQNAFGWKIEKWNGPMDYWLVMTGEKTEPGINGGIFRREGEAKLSEGFPTAVNTVVTIDVSNIDESITKIAEAGGEIVQPKQEIPTVGWIAYARDTEGNIFGIMQATGDMAM